LKATRFDLNHRRSTGVLAKKPTSTLPIE